MHSKKWITIGSATVIFLWIGYYFIIRSLDDPGTFGDMFGALNTLFTGLAFVGVVISLLQQNVSLEKQQKALDQQQTVLKQQQEALNIQKNELELYKNELQENTAQLREQSNHMRLQRLEGTMFRLIESNQEILNNIRVTSGSKGQVILDNLQSSIYEMFNQKKPDSEKMLANEHITDDELKEHHLDLYRSYYAYLSVEADRSARFFISIIQFIDDLEGEISDEDRYYLASILRLHISYGTLFYYRIMNYLYYVTEGSKGYSLFKKYEFF